MTITPSFQALVQSASVPTKPRQETGIPGLYWIENDWVKTGFDSCIVMPSEGPLVSNIVWGGGSEKDSQGYEVYGIHVGQTDRLTFVNGKDIFTECVDCRSGSATLHKKVTFSFDGDPRRQLVIERGVAHRFDNIRGVVIRNEPIFYWDFGTNPDFFSDADTINVPKDVKQLKEFPTVQVNSIRVPDLLIRSIMSLQRMRIWSGQTVYPFRFKVGGKYVKLTPSDYSQGSGINI